MIQDKQLEAFANILEKFNIANPKILGKGGEGIIVEYKGNALKIYYKTTETHLSELCNLQKYISSQNFSFTIPQILEIGSIGNTYYSIENILTGVQMDKTIPSLSSKDRKILFKNYYDAIKQINSVSISGHKYGQILSNRESIISESWVDFLTNKLRQKVNKTKIRYADTIKDYEQKAILLESIIKSKIHTEENKFVHGDYYLNNVLVDDNLSISAVLDFSLHTLVGDPLLDVSSVLTWNSMDKNIHPDDYSFLYEIARKDYGDGLDLYVDIYNLYSSFYYSDMDDASFSINNLNNESIWRRISQ